MIPGSPIEDTGSMILRLLRGRGNGVMPTMQPPAQPPAQPTPTPQQTVPPLDSPPTPRVAPTSALLSRAEKIKNPFLKTLGTLGAGALNVADRLGSGLVPEFTALTPGTSLNTTLGNQRALENYDRQQQLETSRLSLAPKLDTSKDAWKPVTGTNYEINERTGETRPMSGIPAPTPKSRMQQKILSGPDGQPIAANFDPATGKYFDASGQEITNPQPWQKSQWVHTVVMIAGKPMNIEYDPNNPDNRRIIGEAQPNFAQTGLYEPTEVPVPGGGMAPATFNRRTGTVTKVNPQNAPIPAAAQKEINSDLASARNMDRLENAQQQILDEAQKRGQKGPMGGGPYLNGPESMQFVSNHIAMTFGGVKGARVGRDLIEAHIKARDLDQATEAAAQRVLAGGVITFQQAQQMMGTSKINRAQMWNQAKQAAQQYGVPDAVKLPSDLAGEQGPPQGVTVPKGWSWTQQDGQWGITDGKNFRPYQGK